MKHESRRAKTAPFSSPAAVQGKSTTGIKQAGAPSHQQGSGSIQLSDGPASATGAIPFQLQPNNTGLPDPLKSGVENLSGFSMNDVKVHYNSARPAQLQAHAFAQGTDIHVAPGKEQHLAHEAWHVVQQKQGRVQPTVQLKAGVGINDDAGLEKEADEMGSKASQLKTGPYTPSLKPIVSQLMPAQTIVSQLMPIQLTRDELEYGYYGRDGKKKSQKVIRMEEFGDRNRIHNLDPNKLGEKLEEDVPEMGIKEADEGRGEKGDIDKKLGIWRPSKAEGTARPEDPPIYQPFRKAFHETHNIMLSLKLTAETLDTGSYERELLRVGKSVKDRSLEYKAKVRNFSNETTIGTLKNEYFAQLEELKVQVVALGARMIKEYKESSPLLQDSDNDALKEVKSKHGEAEWRSQWWAVVQRVNGILSTKWSVGKAAIKRWVEEKRETLSYMDPNMIGDLDYIGSLAKGYKSAPKQYLRFLPENFDVDAKLDAPPLAVYAISQGEPVDRGSVKHGEHIEPLGRFEESVWSELKDIPGIDKEDTFEVFIRADNVKDLIGASHPHIKAAHQEDSFSFRLQEIQNRIWWLKSKNIDYMATIHELMRDYVSADGKLKARETGFVEKADTKKYTEPDLSLMESHLTTLEKQPVPPPKPGSLARPYITTRSGRKVKQVMELTNRIDQVRSKEIERFWDSPALLIQELEEGLEAVKDTPPLELLNWDLLEKAGPGSLIHPAKNPYVLTMARSFTSVSIADTLRWIRSLPVVPVVAVHNTDVL